MNKVILIGRLTYSPGIRYTQDDNPVTVANFTLAINRRFRRKGEPATDFINCVAFGRNGEFVEKYFRKGQMVGVVGRLQVRSWDDRDGIKHWTTEVIVEENYFVESKASCEERTKQGHRPHAEPGQTSSGFYPVDEIPEDDLPF